MQRQVLSAIRVGVALIGVAAVTWICSTVIPLNAASVGFVYLILILVLATGWGFTEAAVASLAAVLCYNFFFLPPIGKFTISDSQNWVALFTFLITALVASHFSNRARRQTVEAKRRQQETEGLYALSRAILLMDAAKPVGPQAVQHIAQIFEADAVVLYDSQSGAFLKGGAGEIAGSEELLKQVVLRGAAHRDAEGGVDAWPIALGGNPIGALAATRMNLSDSAIQAVLNLVAIALERVRAEEASSRAAAARQNDEFKSTLLDAIAHEFKTPLTSIRAASTALLSDPKQFGAPQLELISIIDEETDRLGLLVTEAVRMSQIDAGKIKLDRTATQVGTLWRTATASFHGRGDDRIGPLESPRDVPDVLVDVELVRLALRQLIDNGLKYTPPTSAITPRLEWSEGRVLLRVVDQGAGIPERDRERIFDKFYRRANVRDKVPGTGLGLHIAREIARAHGGDLWVEAPAGQGAQFCLALPQKPDGVA